MTKAKQTEEKEIEGSSDEKGTASQADFDLPKEEKTTVSATSDGVTVVKDELIKDTQHLSQEVVSEAVSSEEGSEKKVKEEGAMDESELSEEKEVEEPEVEEEKVGTKEEEIPVRLTLETSPPSKLSSLINKKNILIVLAVVGFLGVTGGGIFVYKKTTSDSSIEERARAGGSPDVEELDQTSSGADSDLPKEKKTTVSSSSDGGMSEEETPTPELKREDLKIQVLNGTGAPGIAGEAKEFLEDLGYKEIEAGNADAYDYKETEISIKEDKKDYLEQLTGDLSEKYTLSDETKTLSEDIEFDAVVIVGKK